MAVRTVLLLSHWLMNTWGLFVVMNCIVWEITGLRKRSVKVVTSKKVMCHWWTSVDWLFIYDRENRKQVVNLLKLIGFRNATLWSTTKTHVQEWRYFNIVYTTVKRYLLFSKKLLGFKKNNRFLSGQSL